MKKFYFSLILLLLFSASNAQNKNINKKISNPKITNDGIFANIETTKGRIIIKLEYKKAPLTVANFIALAEGTNSYVHNKYKGLRFYDGLKFPIVILDFLIKSGDPDGNGKGGPGYVFVDEINDSKFNRPGVVAMNSDGPNTNGSQFFITRKEAFWLNGKNTIFGYVISGQNVVNTITPNDIINKVKINRIGNEALKFSSLDIINNNYNKNNIVIKKIENNVSEKKEETNSNNISGDYICLSGNCENGYGEKSYDGHIYKGNFKNGKRDGYGEFYWTFGDVYKGNWKNHDFDGYGIRTYGIGRGNMSGLIEEGIYKNGIFVEDYSKRQIVSSQTNKVNSKKSNNSTQKKYTTPPLHLSTKELGEWFDSEEGQKYLQQSGMLNAVQNELFNQALSGSSSSNSSSNNKTNIKGGARSCTYCSKQVTKPSLKNNPRCQTEYTKTTNPGYILCTNCQGYGYKITTGIRCDCIDGIGWCYDKECEMSSCDNGWVKCSHCN